MEKLFRLCINVFAKLAFCCSDSYCMEHLLNQEFCFLLLVSVERKKYINSNDRLWLKTIAHIGVFESKNQRECVSIDC
jgi:hypothetical protein